MDSTNSGTMQEFVKRNWALLVIWLMQLVVGAFWTGIALNRLDNRIDRIGDSVADIQKSQPSEMRWRIETQANLIAEMKNKQEAYSSEAAKVSSKLDLLVQKVDYLVERQKDSEPRKP